ncbi:hypothetical protein MZK47_15025 [Microbacterium aerolatum]|nr:hypothetical protein [Microbacterium aerolatum]MCK3770984.1 hypothetical protein [Microbacterium aerolatum]
MPEAPESEAPAPETTAPATPTPGEGTVTLPSDVTGTTGDDEGCATGRVR